MKIYYYTLLHWGEGSGQYNSQVNIRPPLGLSRRVARSGISNVEKYGPFKFCFLDDHIST